MGCLLARQNSLFSLLRIEVEAISTYDGSTFPFKWTWASSEQLFLSHSTIQLQRNMATLARVHESAALLSASIPHTIGTGSAMGGGSWRMRSMSRGSSRTRTPGTRG